MKKPTLNFKALFNSIQFNSIQLNSLLILTLAMLALFSTPSFALGKLGHQLTCQLAFEQLTPASQQKLTHLLNTMPKAELKALNKYNYRNADEANTFAKACTWADAIKREPEFERFKSWHYINVDRDKLTINKQSCNKDCVTQAVTYHQQQLKTSTSDKEKLQALMFLGHWLGDIHQPLHVSFASDFGGNKTKVKSTDGKCTNLHWLWDQCLLTRQITTKDHQARYDFLHQKLTQLLDENKANGNIARWQKDDVYTWASESIVIARQPEFGYCTITKNNVCRVNSPQPHPLIENYQEHYTPVINQQVIKAASRLAYRLEQAL